MALLLFEPAYMVWLWVSASGSAPNVTVAIAHSMYNYNRMERMVVQKEIEASKLNDRLKKHK